MKAIIWTKYGSPDCLKLQEVEKPVPNDNEVLIKVHAASVTTADIELRKSNTFSVFWLPMRIYIGLFKPTRIKILGQEVAGKIEGVGKDVIKFKVGDPVYAWSALRLSGYAEYICLSENAMMAIKPDNISFEEAAVISVGAFEAWHYLKGNIQVGQRVLVVGAGGTIGTFGVQIAKYLGAEVTAVDSTSKLDMLHSIGADHVIDYTQVDFTKTNQTYDVIFDAPGKTSFSRCKKLLKPNGQFLTANPGIADQFRTMWDVFLRRRQTAPDSINQRHEEFMSLRELIAEGKIKSIIDRIYQLEQTAEAHRYVETGYKKGNVVITLE
jgi:NADPH:quinone reductase-like Zn-dependent oxidoreductase